MATMRSRDVLAALMAFIVSPALSSAIRAQGATVAEAAVKRIRAVQTAAGRAATPALALTAFARDEDRARALSAGYDEHLAKPLEPEDLLATIARLI